MQKLLSGCGLLVSLSLFAGCATTAPGLGDQANSTSLPSGLRLLDSDEGDCDGAVQIGEEAVEGHGDGLQGSFVVKPGQNATFEFEDGYHEIDWACVGGSSSDARRTDCPSDTSHVRITRANSGGDLIFECYG